jgi:hypothetical protein
MNHFGPDFVTKASNREIIKKMAREKNELWLSRTNR